MSELAFTILPLATISTEYKAFLLLLGLISVASIIAYIFGFKRLKAWLPFIGVELERELENKSSENTGIKDINNIEALATIIGQQEFAQTRDVYLGPTTIIYRESHELKKELEETKDELKTLKETAKQPQHSTLTAQEAKNIMNTLKIKLEKRDYEHLEDFMRESIQKALINHLEIALAALTEHVKEQLEKHATEKPDNIARLAQLVTQIGKYGCRKKAPRSFEVTMGWLTDTTRYCTDKQFRNAADVFNNKVDELYNYGMQSFLEEK